MTAEKAISFISKGWREVKHSTEADIRLMKDRAKSIKNSGAKLQIDFDDREGYWETFRAFKSRLQKLEKKRSSLEIFEGINNHEFVVKVKSSLKAICKEPDSSKDIPPLDFPELMAYLVRQSWPFLDQLGVKKDVSDKIVESLCHKSKNQLLLTPIHTRESFNHENDTINDDLDSRIASVVHSTGHHYESGLWNDFSNHEISNGKRHVAIVTTASLPWMTGTAVNPLFRAAYLAKSRKQSITLLVPWLTRKDQELVYPNITFTSREEQEVYIRSWLEERIGFKTDFKISFYPGKFQKDRRSIIPAGDTSKLISSKDADIAILEEPEHLNWYHHGNRWTNKFNHVVGIVHTNYLEYIKREKHGALQAFFVKHINNLVTRAYCDKVLRLSAATQDLPKSVICNVHGVNPKFLKIGEKAAAERENGRQSFSEGAYFLGKMVWAKGYRELIDLLAKEKDNLSDGFKIDVYGNGEDANEVETTAKKLNLNVNFKKGIDHADDSLHSYKVFINSSVSDVLCTATAEALAMGKFVVCADHPSNDFFRSFPNCLTYNSPQDFVKKVKLAMESEPHPLTSDQRFNLSWEAATQRFMEYSELDKILNQTRPLTRKSNSVPNLIDGTLAFAHYCFTGNEFLRLCTGAVPGTRHYNKQHSSDLHLLPPHVENPIYGW
ncbi:hypothetical protein L1987_81741 [Smallanthus sonchifolius]|uniref:Uncharacterized protein n=1 Tax=Smallanthus sonchifolius TaxID=185202 RepID=A0ACB8YSJ0_9ASTR|nr:hypothetical protein L1987_81741 [Smallanthus sonchifolius]